MAWELLGSIGGAEEYPFSPITIEESRKYTVRRLEVGGPSLIVVVAETNNNQGINSYMARIFIGDSVSPPFRNSDGEFPMVRRVDSPGLYEVGVDATSKFQDYKVWGTVYIARL